MEGIAAAGVARAIPCLHPERHQLSGDRRAEEPRFAALKAKWQGRSRSPTGGAPTTPASRPATSSTSAPAGAPTTNSPSRSTPTASRPRTSILRMVRIMQVDPKLGILQSLVVGMPSTSAFARIFQFGMRLGMRSYTLGSAWWQGDCGPYWGHNAVIRLAPFIAHCHIPPLPGRHAHPQPRPDRGGADAARRLRGARAARGRRELGGEPADAARIHPPRPALGAGQHAVLAASW